MAEIILNDILEKIYSKRLKGSKKYDFGNLLVIGGSDYYSGAPALSALAAFAAGADMVRIAAPKRAADIIASFSPLLAATPMEGERLNENHLSILEEIVRSMAAVAPGKSAVVIGGGIGRSPDSIEAIKKFILTVDVPTVVDADAIWALAGNSESLANRPLLITPHLREFEELTGNDLGGKTEEEKIKIVASQAKSLGVAIILKGGPDVISDGTRTVLNETGSALMTKGGTGDTLAGIAGALLARGAGFFEAASAAAYINGAAGDRAGIRLGEGVTAMDLINEIPNILPKYEY